MQWLTISKKSHREISQMVSALSTLCVLSLRRITNDAMSYKMKKKFKRFQEDFEEKKDGFEVGKQLKKNNQKIAKITKHTSLY